MKNKIISLSLLTMTMALGSCIDDINNDTAYITEPIEFDATTIVEDISYYNNYTISDWGDIAEVNINATNIDWEFKGVPQWINIDALRGNSSKKVTINIGKNTDFASRTGVFSLDYGFQDNNYTIPFYFSQRGTTPILEWVGGESRKEIDATAQTITFDFETNLSDLEARYSLGTGVDESHFQFNVDYSSKQFTVKANENLGNTTIYCYIYLASPSTSESISATIVQNSPITTTSTQNIEAGYAGGDYEIQFSSNVTWNATCSGSWFDITPTSGNAGQDQTLKISVLPSNQKATREGEVSIMTGTTSRHKITIKQEGISVNIQESKIEPFQANDNTETKTVTVVSTTDWNVISKPDWLTVSPESGTIGSTTLNLTASENPSAQPREGILKIGNPNVSDVYDEITISQLGQIVVDETALQFNWTSSTMDIEINAGTSSWQAMVSDEWITITPESGNGKSSMTVSVSTNDNEDARTGTITVVVEDKLFKISIVQAGQYLKIDNTTGIIDAMGGSTSLTVYTTVGATTEIQYEGETTGWLSAEIAENSSENSIFTYLLTAAYNPSQNPRNATFVINPTSQSTNESCTAGVKYYITQEGRSISASTGKIIFFAKGGTSEPYTISVSGDYSIEKANNENWFLISHNSNTNTFSIISSENNTGSNRYGAIKLSLLNLPEGEEYSITIPIIQLSSTAKWVEIDDFNGYDDDEDWN